MTRIKLVVSDVDGTLVTKEKKLTDAAKAAVEKLRAAGIGFTIVSSRPTIGMDFLVKPLALTLPFGSFNGSSIVGPQMRPIEEHLIPPEVVRRAIDLFEQFGVDIWLFTRDQWLARDPNGEYVGHERFAIKHDPVIVGDFTPYSNRVCKIVGASSNPELLMRCEAAMQQAVGKEAVAARSQTYYLDVTPPGHDKGTFVANMAAGLGVPLGDVATIGDMQNDLPMFERSSMSFAMGNAADEIKQHATHVTASNEDDGFAKAMEVILAGYKNPVVS
ncbi:MAG TPA: HAD family hydrolase [Bradyrhizobium sp.]|nr:HAD family hydrolase [Bradyrhizobium sp.]